MMAFETVVRTWEVGNLLQLVEAVLEAHQTVIRERGLTAALRDIGIPPSRVDLLRSPPAFGADDRRPDFAIMVNRRSEPS